MANSDSKNTALLKMILAGLVALGAVGVFFFTHFLPFGFAVQRERIDALKSEFEKKSTELTRAKASVADLPRFEAEYEQLHERWVMAAELLPVERQLAALLRKITIAGQQTGVRFLMFRPGSPKAETYYTEMPMEIAVNGNYHQVGSFLAELANMRRIVTVANVKLSTNSKSDGGSTAASINASAYSLNANAAAPPPPAPAAQPGGDAQAKGGANEHEGS
jgi:type IV pilus assembly protein PilO